MKGVLVALSGGVDSGVSAYLVKKERENCIGVTMRMTAEDDPHFSSVCAAHFDEDVTCAADIAHKLDMPFRVFSYADAFTSEVVDRFVSEYFDGLTPNPCIFCNKHLKFGALLDTAVELGCDAVATGHYARIEKSGDRYLLKKSADPQKDQTYMLWSLSQYQLAHTLFPLGAMTKSEVREIAAEQGFLNAKRRESQDICFIVDGDYATFIESYANKTSPKGTFVDKEGRALGVHKGLIHYTIGQRKGLGLALPAPLYVCEKNVCDNTVVLGTNEDLFTTTFTVRDPNWIAFDAPPASFRAAVKVRYRQNEQPATVFAEGETVKVVFDTPQRAISAGQSAVFYDGDLVIGGGIIS